MRRLVLGLVLSTVVVGLAIAAWAPVRGELGQVLALLGRGDLPALRDYLRGFGVWGPLVSCALMQVQALVAPLPSFPIMYANGLLYGTLWGGLLSWASLLGSALLCFGVARAFGRPLVERIVSPTALAWVDQSVVSFGPYAVFLARLVPLTAFDLLSYAAGLTPIRPIPFAVATGLGMAPAIFLSAAAGEIGMRSPWALAGGLLVIAGLAGLAALCRPALARRVAAAAPELSERG